MAAHDNNDDDGLSSFLRREAILGRIEVECKRYLDENTFRDEIYTELNERRSQLELFADGSAKTIQQILNQNQSIDTIHLRNTPTFLPIIISQVTGDSSSCIIPSSDLNINRLRSRAPLFQLEAIICDINQHKVIFMRDLRTDKWYYYQKNKNCQELDHDLSRDLNDILQSNSTREQEKLIRSAHFLLSVMLFNATKYIYKQKTNAN